MIRLQVPVYVKPVRCVKKNKRTHKNICRQHEKHHKAMQHRDSKEEMLEIMRIAEHCGKTVEITRIVYAALKTTNH